MEKGTKKKIVIGLGVAVLAFLGFKVIAATKKDKMGGVLTTDANGETYYNGKPVPGTLVPGSIQLVNGYWRGLGIRRDGSIYEFRGDDFYRVN